MKKAAVMLYPLFSMQEISCTTELFKFYDKEIVTFTAGGEAVRSEDGFTILPDKAFAEFEREEFDCLLLPGIWEPLPVMGVRSWWTPEPRANSLCFPSPSSRRWRRPGSLRRPV